MFVYKIFCIISHEILVLRSYRYINLGIEGVEQRT